MDTYAKVKQVPTNDGKYGVEVCKEAATQRFEANDLYYVGLADVYANGEITPATTPVLEDCYTGNIWIKAE